MFGERTLWVRLAALSGFVSVAAGAFAAHGLAAPLAKELMRTGAAWQEIHAVAALTALALRPARAPGPGLAPALFLAGSALFGGSLYLLALGAPRWIGAVTPLGGLAFLAGWAVMAWSAAGPGAGEQSP